MKTIFYFSWLILMRMYCVACVVALLHFHWINFHTSFSLYRQFGQLNYSVGCYNARYFSIAMQQKLSGLPPKRIRCLLIHFFFSCFFERILILSFALTLWKTNSDDSYYWLYLSISCCVFVSVLLDFVLFLFQSDCFCVLDSSPPLSFPHSNRNWWHPLFHRR